MIFFPQTISFPRLGRNLFPFFFPWPRKGWKSFRDLLFLVLGKRKDKPGLYYGKIFSFPFTVSVPYAVGCTFFRGRLRETLIFLDLVPPFLCAAGAVIFSYFEERAFSSLLLFSPMS